MYGLAYSTAANQGNFSDAHERGGNRMISREGIILMIEQMNTAVEEIQKEIDRRILLLEQSESVAEVAAAKQLKSVVLDGVMVQGNTLKDMTTIYELAQKTKMKDDMLLMQDILFWRKKLERALVFQRVWRLYPTALEKCCSMAAIWRRAFSKRDSLW